MQVSFIVPLYNCLPLTQAMVASLQSSLPPDLRYEIILVDDGSTDGTREWLGGLSAPFRVLLNPENLGYAAANNRAVAIAQGEFLVLLNNDLLFTPHWLPPLLALHRKLGDRAGLVGNVQRLVSTGELDHTGIEINHQGKPAHLRRLPWWSWLPGGGDRTTLAITGACVVLQRPLWDELGGFDERYVNGCEDVDLCLRAAATRRVNAVSFRSIIYHHVSSSPGRKRRDEENTWKFVQRWRDELLLRGARSWSDQLLANLRTADPAETDFRLLLDAFLYSYHLSASPSARVIMGMEKSLDHELRRWRELFDHA